MRWIDISEKEMIKAWAREEQTDEIVRQYFTLPDKNEKSYWCRHDEGGEIEDYGFENLMELRQFLRLELKDEFYDELMLPIAVAVFKEQYKMGHCEKEAETVEYSNTVKDGLVIPEFVYVF